MSDDAAPDPGAVFAGRDEEIESLRPWYGREVVVDTRSDLLYIGVLTLAGRHFLTLADVDVHDNSDYTVTKEVYILESRKFGVKKNRTEVRVRTSEVLSLSLLDDVIPY